jgi:hypothetical protein
LLVPDGYLRTASQTFFLNNRQDAKKPENPILNPTATPVTMHQLPLPPGEYAHTS